MCRSHAAVAAWVASRAVSLPPPASASSATATDCQAFRAFPRAGRCARPGRRNGHFLHAVQTREAHRGHGPGAVPPSLSQHARLPVARRLLHADRQHRRQPALPSRRIGSFVHGPRGRRPVSEHRARPPLCRIYERSAVGRLPPNGPPPPSFGVFARRGSKVIGWWVRELGRPSPFFDPKTGAPCVQPKILSRAEREALA